MPTETKTSPTFKDDRATKTSWQLTEDLQAADGALAEIESRRVAAASSDALRRLGAKGQREQIEALTDERVEAEQQRDDVAALFAAAVDREQDARNAERLTHILARQREWTDTIAPAYRAHAEAIRDLLQRTTALRAENAADRAAMEADGGDVAGLPGTIGKTDAWDLLDGTKRVGLAGPPRFVVQLPSVTGGTPIFGDAPRGYTSPEEAEREREQRRQEQERQAAKNEADRLAFLEREAALNPAPQPTPVYRGVVGFTPGLRNVGVASQRQSA